MASSPSLQFYLSSPLTLTTSSSSNATSHGHTGHACTFHNAPLDALKEGHCSPSWAAPLSISCLQCLLFIRHVWHGLNGLLACSPILCSQKSTTSKNAPSGVVPQREHQPQPIMDYTYNGVNSILHHLSFPPIGIGPSPQQLVFL